MCARDPCCRGHAPAKDRSIALHRANFGRALRPAELFSSKRKALEQMARGKGNAFRFIQFGLVEDTKLDGIDFELIGEFIHRRFGRIKSGHGAGSPHGRRRADIAPGATELDAQIGHAVMEGRGLAAVFVIVIENRLVQNVIMLERNEFPIGRRAEPYALLGARTIDQPSFDTGWSGGTSCPSATAAALVTCAPSSG